MKEFDNSKILIIGGAGFVGSNLAQMLLKNSGAERVCIVDNLLSSERDNIPLDKKIDFICGSIADDEVLNLLEDVYDYVFHLATFHGNQNSIYDPISDHDNNTITTLKLFNRLKSFKNIKKIVYSGAGCASAKKIYGDAYATTEEEPINIVQDSPYSISKLVGEFYSAYFYKQHNVPIVRARFQNVYGPKEILGAGKWRGTSATVWRNVIPTFIFKALNSEALPVENSGIASRDFIYVEDICTGLIACALRGKPGDVYNLASGRQTTILELATLINELTGNKSKILNLPKRNWDTSGNRYGSPKKASAELGFEAEISLESGLRHTIEWTKQNFSIIESHIAKHKQELATL